MSELRNRATMDSTQFQAGLNNMKKEVQGLAKSLKSMPGLPASLSVLGLIATIRSTMMMADEIDNLSNQLGLSAEAVQAYKIGLEEAGMSTGDLQSATDRLRRQQSMAISGNERARQSFQALGVSMDDLRGADTERLLEMVAQGMHQTDGDAQAAAASYDLLGRNSERLRDVLIQLNQDGIQAQIQAFKELGLVVDESVIATLDRAQLTLERYGRQAKMQAATLFANVGQAFEFTVGTLGAMSVGENLFQAMETSMREIERPLEEARKAREERQKRELQNRIAGEERAANQEIENLQERRRLQQMTNDELRQEWQTRLEIAQREKEQAESAVERLEALRQIVEAENQLSRIRDPLEREMQEEGAGLPNFANLVRMGALGAGSGEREQVQIAQRSLRAQEGSWRVLNRIEQQMGGGATL